MKKIRELIYVSVFVLIAGYVCFNIISSDVKYVKYENREAYELPDFNVREFLFCGADKGLESALKDRFFRDELVKYDVLCEKNIFRREFINSIHVKSPHFYDFSESEKYVGAEDKTHDCVKRLAYINERLKENGSRLLVIPVPMISSIIDYPSYVLNPELIDRDNSVELKKLFDENGIDYIDTRKLLKRDAFFDTDHHISTIGFDELYPNLKKYFEKNDINLVDTTIDYIKHRFKGSRSRMLADVTCDEIIYEPKYDRALTRLIDGKELIDDFETSEGYTSYMCGDIKETLVKADDGKGANIVIYGDSFTNVFESLLAPRVGSMHSYDIRFGRSDEPVMNADIVILIAQENSFRLGEEYLLYIK